MRLILAAALLIAAPVLAQTGLPGVADRSRVAAGTYPVDPNHTQVTWSVNHMGFSLLEGQIGASAGSITIDPTRPNATRVDVTFPVAELTTTSAGFTKHLGGGGTGRRSRVT